MEYKFKSTFNHDEEFHMNLETDITSYDIFSISISKVDNHKKDYSPENINCILRCFKRNSWNSGREIDLETSNFTEYPLLIEKFKERNCTSMGIGIDIIKEKKPLPSFNGMNYENTTPELRNAFNEIFANGYYKELMFKIFLEGVEYGRRLKE